MLHVDQQMPVLPHGTSAIKDSQDPSYPGNPLVTYLSLRTTGPLGPAMFQRALSCLYHLSHQS